MIVPVLLLVAACALLTKSEAKPTALAGDHRQFKKGDFVKIDADAFPSTDYARFKAIEFRNVTLKVLSINKNGFAILQRANGDKTSLINALILLPGKKADFDFERREGKAQSYLVHLINTKGLTHNQAFKIAKKKYKV